jgi:hypothetical protein
VVSLIGEDGQMRQRRDGLQAEIRHLRARFLLTSGGQETGEIGLADGLLLDTDFLRIRHDNVEDAASDDRDIALTVARERQLQ